MGFLLPLQVTCSANAHGAALSPLNVRGFGLVTRYRDSLCMVAHYSNIQSLLFELFMGGFICTVVSSMPRRSYYKSSKVARVGEDMCSSHDLPRYSRPRLLPRRSTILAKTLATLVLTPRSVFTATRASIFHVEFLFYNPLC
jgi:hypothetical protein